MTRLRRRWLPMIAVFVAAACGSPPMSDAVIEDYHVRLALQPDGVVDVRETLKVRAFARPPQRFERTLQRIRIDRFTDIRASFDEPGQASSTAAEVVTRRSGDVQVVWPGPGQESVRTYQLEYRAVGALEVHGTVGWLRFRILPLEPDYPIGESSIELTVPSTMRVLETPSIDDRWAVTSTPTIMTARRSAIAPGDPATFTVRLDVRSHILLESTWQQSLDRAREMAPAFLSGAFFILVIGVGAVVMVFVQYPRRKIEPVAHVGEAARGLIVTGLVVLALGIASGAGVPFVVERYGRAVGTIPISMAIVSAVMIAGGLLLRRRAR